MKEERDAAASTGQWSRRTIVSFALILAVLGCQFFINRSSLACSTHDIVTETHNTNRRNHHHEMVVLQSGENISLLTGSELPFCQRWSSADALNRSMQPFDEWHTHHPTWFVTKETEDMFCVEPMCQDGFFKRSSCSYATRNLIRDFLRFYANQFQSSCERVHYRPMWSSGWGADFRNVFTGLIRVTDGPQIPLVMSAPWHYAANKNDASNMTCDQADLTCYFLPYHDCGSHESICGRVPSPSTKKKTCPKPKMKLLNATVLKDQNLVEKVSTRGDNAYKFMTRKQLWLRRAVFDFKQQFKLKYNNSDNDDCTVIHVRRSDVVLHEKLAPRKRYYYSLSAYVNQIPEEKCNNTNHTIFLLTDDTIALREAHQIYPELRWRYIDRPRHTGSSGGFENQTPSRNPALEVIIMLATFELAGECSVLVHGISRFADFLWQHMNVSRIANKYPINESTRMNETQFTRYLDREGIKQ